MDLTISNTIVAVLSLLGLKYAIGFGVDCIGYWNLGRIFSPRKNQFLLHHYLREYGAIPDPVRDIVANILKDFGSCIQRDHENIYERFQRYNKLEIDAFSILHLDPNDPNLMKALKVVNHLFMRSFRLPTIEFGNNQARNFIEFSLNEYDRLGHPDTQNHNMLELEEQIQILRARRDGVEKMSAVRVRISLIDLK